MRLEEDDIVQYPVHKRFLPVVVQAHAAAIAAEANIPPAETPMPTETTRPQEKLALIDWAQVVNMKKLRRGLAKQSLRPGLKVQIGIALMDAVAEATLADPPRRVTFEEVYERAGFDDPRSARSSLGAMTKVIRREFHVSYEEAKSPVEPNWGDRGEAHYSMRVEIARAWLASAE